MEGSLKRQPSEKKVLQLCNYVKNIPLIFSLAGNYCANLPQNGLSLS